MRISKFILYTIWVVVVCNACSRSKEITDTSSVDLQIIVDRNAPSSVQLAADELQYYLERMTASTIIVSYKYQEQIAKTIYLGNSEALKRVFKNKKNLKHDSFITQGSDTHLIIVGNDTPFRPNFDYAKSYEDIPRANALWQSKSGTITRSPIHGLYKAYNKEFDLWEYDSKGTLYGVYSYLRSLGVEWFTPSEEGEHVPRLNAITWNNGYVETQPDFALRWHYRYAEAFVQSDEEDLLWYLRLGLNRDENILGIGEPGHGISNVVADNRIRSRHPEYFALYNGKRANGVNEKVQVCLSSQGLKELNIKYARSVFDLYDVKALSVMPPDGFTHMCECDLCKGKNTPDRGREGKLSDYVWNYVNEVASELYKTHPDKIITCFAYGYSLLPPKNISKLSPNIRVAICRNRESFHDPERNKFYNNLQDKWSKLTSTRLLTYDYYLYARPLKPLHGIPVFIPRIISNDLKSLKEDNVIGEFVEVLTDYDGSQGDIVGIINDITVFLTARLYWDTNLNVDALLEKYFDCVYPSSNQEVKAFYSYLEKYWFEVKENAAKLDEALRLLDIAITKTDGIKAKNRLIEIKKYITPLKVNRRKAILNDPEQREIRVIKCTSSIQLDGKLNEPAWKSPFDFRMSNPKSINRREELSRVQFTWCDGVFNIGAKMIEPNISELKSNSNNDARSQNYLLIDLNTLNGEQLIFTVNLNGDIKELDVPDGYRNKIEAAVHIGKKEWYAEIRIPITREKLFSKDFGLKGHIPTDSYPWFFNIRRVRSISGKQDAIDFANYTNGKRVENPLSKIYFRGY